MGFLPNIFKIKSPIDVLVPVLPLVRESIKIAAPLVRSGIQELRDLVPTGAKGAPQQYAPGNYSYQQQYPAPYLGSYGGGSWDSSTSSGMFSGNQTVDPYLKPDSLFWEGEDWGAEWRSR